MAAADFQEVAKHYRLIRAEQINILVPYDPDEFALLMEQIRAPGPREPQFLRRWIARARPLTVGHYMPREEAPIWTFLDEIHFARRPAQGDKPDWYAALPDTNYDELLGLVEPGEHNLSA